MDTNASYDLQAAQVIQRVLSNNSNCVDVGCHAGSFMDQFLAHAPDGTHYAFEPLPDLCEKLRQKYANHHNVVVIEAALSDTDGVSRFTHVVTNPGYSGLRERRYDRPDEQLEEIVVPVRRIDDVIDSSCPICLIKIDVEGAELQVLRGATAILERCRPFVIFEHGLGAADCYGTTPGNIHELLVEQLGFQIYLMEDWLERGAAYALTAEQFHDEFASGRNFYFMAASPA
jgi:FkbM family methyltransferase